MLFLLFQMDRDRYALEASQIAEVLPLVEIKKIPHAPRGVAGVFNYRGAPVPAVDLSELMLGRPAPARLDTRILVVREQKSGTRLLGLIAENATATLRREPQEFVASGVSVDGAAYLGPVTQDARGLIQWVEVDKLLSEPVRAALYSESLDA